MNTTVRKESAASAQNRVDGRPTRPEEGPRDTREYVYPPVNITETRDAFLLEAEMPGVNKTGLEISLEGNELTIIGHRQDETPKAQLVYRESRPSDYKRVFELDPSIEASKITARMDQGVLHLTLPKAEKVKPRKIAVTD